ncbi:SDR family oxidoreductase [Allostreptomyces psammosilenae]|uniref:2-deoxy-D-gluconate 3-dehydrogenase n=1 Tax=Allostreptomyces psammosilenae TaxID=1892865 RepID=A0A853A7U7_9ACTN|nr:SDR family oxidoreductase [Allostreptomyces psammosilenae]NYI06608.1 2-deoxy-D-gluconate 3-dehydrogenase [Allostreptomyces psammosilenae]
MSPHPFDLTGRTALVTGARTGIGRAAALALARAGADLVLLGNATRPPERTAEEVTALGRAAHTVACDLAHPEAVPEAAAEILARHRIDILVNNAGIIRRSPAAEHPYEDWREVMRVNTDSLFQLSRHLGRPMLERGSGKIVNIASLLAFQGGLNVASYAAAKHAVAGLTKALANEWSAHGVQVNAVAPGYISTDNTAPLRAEERREREIRARIPAGRWGTPEDVAGAVVFLASPAADYVSGHVLVVDGGWMSR